MRPSAPLQVIHGLERKLERAREKLVELEHAAAQVPAQRVFIAELQVAISVLSSLDEPAE